MGDFGDTVDDGLGASVPEGAVDMKKETTAKAEGDQPAGSSPLRKDSKPPAGSSANAATSGDSGGNGGGDATAEAEGVTWAFPQARVKKIMKKGKDEKNQLSTDAVQVCAKALEMFAEYLTERVHESMERAGRKTIQYADVYATVENNEEFDFLHEVVPPKKQRRTTPASRSAPPQTQGDVASAK